MAQNSIKLDLSTISFKKPFFRSRFFRILGKTDIMWMRENIKAIKSREKEVEFTFDLDNPPFAKDESYSKNVEDLLKLLANSRQEDVRIAVAKSQLAKPNILRILEKDQSKNVQDVVRRRSA